MLARIAGVAQASLDDVGDAARASASLVAALAARGRVLLLLDGIDGLVLHDRGRLSADAFNSGLVRWVLTARVTTGIAERRVYLGPLDPDAAVAVLRDSATRAGAPELAAAPDEIVALAEQLDRIPLALELGGQWLNTLTVVQLGAALARHGDFLADDDHAGGLQSALAETWARATAEDRAAIIGLCALDGDFTVDLAAAIWACDVPRAARQLRRLQWLSLVWPSSDGGRRRFSVYIAVRAYGRDLASPEALAVASERAARWLADGLETWDLETRRAEAVTLDGAFDWAIAHHVPLAARLALASLSMAEDGDAFAQRLRELSLVLERVVDAPVSDDEVAAQLYFAVGRGHLLARDAAGALEALQSALSLTHDHGLRVRALSALARTQLDTGQLADAERTAQQALALASDDDVPSRIEASGVLAFVHAEALRAEDARAVFARLRRPVEWRGRAVDLAVADSVACRLVALTGAVELLGHAPPAGVSPRAVADFWQRRAETLLAVGDIDGAARAYPMIVGASELRHDARLAKVTAGGLAAVAAVAEGGAPDPVALAELTRHFEAGDWRYLATRARLLWGVTLALAGQALAGARQLERALADAWSMGMTAHALEFQPVAALVAHLAGRRSRPAPSLPEGCGAPPAWLSHTVALGAALVAGDVEVPAVHGLPRWSERAMRRLAGAAEQRDAVAPPVDAGQEREEVAVRLEIDAAWRWLRVGDDARVSLVRRYAGRRILKHLVASARRAPAAMVTRDELLEVGWPGERMRPKSGVARVHTTLWRLRQLGLGEILVSGPAGYRLRDGVQVVFVDGG